MNPYAIAAALVLLIVTGLGGAHLGAKNERATWQKEKLAMQAQQTKDAEAEVVSRYRAQLFNEAKARKASATYEKAITDLKAQYVVDVSALRASGGLRIPRTACVQAAPGSQATGAGRPDEGAAATEELPERTQERLFVLTERADNLAEQLRALQGWVRGQGFYGE